MPPDLNTLPPSPSPADASLQTRPSAEQPHAMSQSPPPAHTPPHSLAAAATLNAGIQNEDLRRQSSGSMRREVERARRRSSIRMNLNLNDPGIPAPGEMQRGPWPHSPHHERTPSLGELHQELEYEQEGQVVRTPPRACFVWYADSVPLEQALEHDTTAAGTDTVSNVQHVCCISPPTPTCAHCTFAHSQLQTQQPTSASAVDDSTPTSERSMSIPFSGPQNNISPLTNPAQPRSRSPYAPVRASVSRQSSFADRSRNSSHAGSPALRPSSDHGMGPHESNDFLPTSALNTRDESAFYQAETQMLTRENQMLKLRIRELGKHHLS